LIFHTSRCGSTLVCRMLAQVPGTVVISEPAIVDQLLRPTGAPEAIRRRRVAAAVAALTRSTPGTQRAVLKLDAWASRHLGLVRAVFPDTPWLFLYREPAEVVASQLRIPGMTCSPGMLPPELFDLGLEQARRMPHEQYCAIVIGTILRDALDNVDDAACLLGYEELPDGVFTRLLPHFGLEADTAARQAMTALAGIDAKRPYQRFDPDAAAKPTAAVLDACGSHADEPYAALRALTCTEVIRDGAPW
jgi:hypothetical protein